MYNVLEAKEREFMAERMREDTIKDICAMLIAEASAAIKESKDKNDPFSQGRELAYYEMLDHLQSQMWANDIDLSEYGLNFDIDKKFYGKAG